MSSKYGSVAESGRWHETFNLTAKAHRGFESHPILQINVSVDK